MLDLKNVQAVIFDMDGTMMDNMSYHSQAWMKFCKMHDVPFTEQEYLNKYAGKKNDEIFQGLFNGKLSRKEIDEYSEEKEQMYRGLYAPFIKEVDGLSDLIKLLKAKGLKIAVATTAPQENRDFGLIALGLEKSFDVIVGDEQVELGKPDPQIYLLTAEKLEVRPKKCLVFEDTPKGVESAKRAGMKVVGVMTSRSAKDLEQADFLIKTFSDVKLKGVSYD